MQCCHFQEGYLAEPQNQEEHDLVSAFITAAINGDQENIWWIGATDMFNEGSYVWLSGAPWSFSMWAEGEPSLNKTGNEDCAAISPQSRGYGWVDLDCEAEEWNAVFGHHAVCEKYATPALPPLASGAVLSPAST